MPEMHWSRWRRRRELNDALYAPTPIWLKNMPPPPTHTLLLRKHIMKLTIMSPFFYFRCIIIHVILYKLFVFVVINKKKNKQNIFKKKQKTNIQVSVYLHTLRVCVCTVHLHFHLFTLIQMMCIWKCNTLRKNTSFKSLLLFKFRSSVPILHRAYSTRFECKLFLTKNQLTLSFEELWMLIACMRQEAK